MYVNIFSYELGHTYCTRVSCGGIPDYKLSRSLFQALCIHMQSLQLFQICDKHVLVENS